MIRVYLLNINELENIHYEESLFGQRRKELIERYKHEEDKKLSAAAELLLIYALKQLDPEVELPLNISVEAKGKPALETKISVTPELSKQGFKNGVVCFSLSHSNEFAACAVSNEPVGVDIEFIKRKEMQYPEKILHKEEAETYAFISNPLEKKKYFFECWTLKESYLKNLGIGLIVRSGDFLISEDRLEASNKKLKPRYAHCLTPGEIRNTDWKFDANYKVSYCIAKKDADAKAVALTAKDFEGLFQ